MAPVLWTIFYFEHGSSSGSNGKTAKIDKIELFEEKKYQKLFIVTESERIWLNEA